MNSYSNHLIDILVENNCLSRTDLFVKSGLENRREFRTMVDRLMKEKRIRYEDNYNGVEVLLSPKVLQLKEFQTKHGTLTRTIDINYVPTPVLEKVLEYTAPGDDPYEDNLDFHLQIEGYPIVEKYKTFFEQENDLTLDFSAFRYTLWAKYLLPRESEFTSKICNIILVDYMEESSNLLMEKMKSELNISSNWFQFTNYVDATFFLENSFLNRSFVSLIIFRSRESSQVLDFKQKIGSVINEFKDVYSDIYIPVLILTEYQDSFDASLIADCPGIGCMYYPSNVSETILSNVIQTQCNKS